MHPYAKEALDARASLDIAVAPPLVDGVYLKVTIYYYIILLY